MIARRDQCLLHMLSPTAVRTRLLVRVISRLDCKPGVIAGSIGE